MQSNYSLVSVGKDQSLFVSRGLCPDKLEVILDVSGDITVEPCKNGINSSRRIEIVNEGDEALKIDYCEVEPGARYHFAMRDAKAKIMLPEPLLHMALYVDGANSVVKAENVKPDFLELYPYAAKEIAVTGGHVLVTEPQFERVLNPITYTLKQMEANAGKCESVVSPKHITIHGKKTCVRDLACASRLYIQGFSGQYVVMPSVEEIDAVVGCMCAILGKNEAWKTGASSCIISVEDNAQAKNRQKAGKICPELPHALVEHEKFLKRANEMTEKYFDCRKIVKAEYRRSSLGLS